jgi:hypothetical protein
MQACSGPVDAHVLRSMRTERPDSGCRAVCRLCEALWGTCGIVGWSARLMAEAYERRVPPSSGGVAEVRRAIGRLERAGQVVTFSYTGCQGELFAAPVSDNPQP